MPGGTDPGHTQDRKAPARSNKEECEMYIGGGLLVLILIIILLILIF